MTEDEAKTKLCPFSIAPHCRGSECMGWRWKYEPHKKGDTYFKFGQRELAYRERDNEGNGFCSLVGKS